MKKIKLKRIAVLSLIVIFIISLIVPIVAATIEELEQQKKSAQSKIDSNNATINSTQTVVDQIEKQILELNTNIDTLEKEINTLKAQIEQLNKDIDTTQKELDAAIQKEKEQNDLLNERIRIQYMYGVEGYSEALFSDEDLTTQIENSQIITDIFKADHDLLEQLKSNKLQIEQKKEQLEKQKIELNSKESQLDTKLIEQETAKSQKEKILNDNKAIIEKAKKEIKEEEATIAAANSEIQRLAQEAEKKAIAERQTKVEEVQAQVQSYSSEITSLSDEVTKLYGNSSDGKIIEYVRQVQALAASVQEKDNNLRETVKKTQSAQTAAQAVEVSSDIDQVLSTASSNVSDAKNIKAELADLDLEKKKQEAIKAAEAAEEKRNQAIQNGQEAVRKEAEEEARRAEEARKKAEEEKNKADQEAEDAKNEADENTNQADQTYTNTNDWEHGYISSTGWRWPLDGIFDITSLFGYRIHPIFGVGSGHEGMDIAASGGTPIHSCDGGTVILAGVNGGYGNCVIIQQDSGHQVYYGHQSQIGVSEGQRVEKGDVIGYVGTTGWSTGNHLHLGVLTGGEFIDPLQFFPELDA